LLTPEQAEVLSLANEMGGHLRLTLRNSEDELVGQGGSTDLSNLLQGNLFGKKSGDGDTASMIDWIKNLQQPVAPQPPTAVASAAGTPDHFTMEIFPGNGVSRVDLVRGSGEGVWSTAKIDELKKPNEEKSADDQQNPAGGGMSGFVMMQAPPAAGKK
jgi:hypothetical protein